MTRTRQIATLLSNTSQSPASFSTLSRYLSDPTFRARLDAERVERQAEIGAGFDAHDRARQEAAWARET